MTNATHEAETPATHEMPATYSTEYTELNKYFVEVVKFRFTALGFYIAGALLILSKAEFKWHCLIILAVSAGFYLVELRNRVLYTLLGQRGAWIEQQWGHEFGYFGRQFSGVRGQASHLEYKPPPGQQIYIGVGPLRIRVNVLLDAAFSHSAGIDVLFFSVVATSIYLLKTLPWG